MLVYYDDSQLKLAVIVITEHEAKYCFIEQCHGPAGAHQMLEKIPNVVPRIVFFTDIFNSLL